MSKESKGTKEELYSVTLDTIKKLNDNGWKGTYLDTGVKGLNKILGGSEDRGLPTHTLTGFLSAPNGGKTLTAIQLAVASAKVTGRPALIIDLENFFSHKGAYEKYIEPLLKRYEVDPKPVSYTHLTLPTTPYV